MLAHSLNRLTTIVDRAVVWMAGVGGLIILIQMLWVTYGVFVRYILGKPDRMVTEATALLLFPVAFAGLAYAMREESYPKVTMLTDTLPAMLRKLITIINGLLMLGIGLFFSLAAVSATIRAFHSGVASEILLWPRYLFWMPGAFALVLFCLYAMLHLIRLLHAIRPEE